MATKKWHIDSVRNNLGALKFKIRPQTVEADINSAYNQVLLEIANATADNVILSRKRFTGIAVTWDSSANVYYSNYPAALAPHLSLSMIISTIIGNGLRVYITKEKTLRLVDGLPVNDLNTRIRAVPKRERIEFYNMESLSDEEIANGATPTPKMQTVRMDMAIEFKDFALTDDIYMPNGQDYKVKQLAIDMLKQEPIIELRNNG